MQNQLQCANRVRFDLARTLCALYQILKVMADGYLILSIRNVCGWKHA